MVLVSMEYQQMIEQKRFETDLEITLKQAELNSLKELKKALDEMNEKVNAQGCQAFVDSLSLT